MLKICMEVIILELGSCFGLVYFPLRQITDNNY